MKETKQDVIQMALALKELEAASIPVNFLHAMEGTILEGTDELNPLYCLKVLCLFLFTNPTTEVRMSGGHEVNLRSLQPLSLYPANSMFIGDYLNTTGQVATKDFQMLKYLGFEIDYGETKASVY